jgi:two-component system OmpR family sensor kinase
MSSPQAAEPLRRSWLKPGTWHLRTRLILVAMTLLIAICGAVGVASYASMDAFLTRQLDEQLGQAAERSNNPGRPPQGGFNGRDPLDARGQSVGTLNARILNGQVNSAGFLASDATRSALSAEDKQALLALATDAQPVDRNLSNGDYRLVAVKTTFGDVLVTGLPLGA